MIKVGIYGPDSVDSRVRKQLLRFLLRHPDVELCCVASPSGNTIPIAELHPVYAGETELTLERVLELDGLDVLFVIDEDNLTDEIIKKYNSDKDFRLILLGEASKTLADKGFFSYGLPEYNRKELVRGARAAVSPRPEAMAIEIALFPLAKSGLLPDDIDISLACGKKDLNPAVGEAVGMLKLVQPSFKGNIKAQSDDLAPYDRIDLVATMGAPVATEEIERIYREAYEDHNFSHLIAGHNGIDEDLRGSNKCLLQLYGEDGKLTVRASMDALTKGITGNAIHLMNLLFGLYERTGLSI